MMVDQLKSVSFLSKSMKNLFAPTTTLTMVHGNQKAVVNKDSTEITDLDKGVVIHIDNLKKTYSVTTFAEMRQAFEQAPKQIEKAQAQVQAQPQPQMPKTDLKTSFEVSVKNTGVTKVINGLTAQEQLVTMQMHITDPNAPPDQVNAMTYVVTTDAWIAPDPPEIKEIQDFDLRMAKKMMAGVDLSAFKGMTANTNAGMAQLFGGHPGSADAMAQMGKEMAKLKGTHVMDVTSMGGMGNVPAGSTDQAAAGSPPGTTPAAAPATPSAPPGTAPVGQASTDAATQTASGQTSKLGGLGSALGQSVLGWRKKKSAPPPDSSATTTPAAASTTSAASAATPAGGQTTAGGTLMEMTLQKTNFSTETIPPSAFQIPAGFTKVPSAFEAMTK
jgi:hypothetical protein